MIQSSTSEEMRDTAMFASTRYLLKDFRGHYKISTALPYEQHFS